MMVEKMLMKLMPDLWNVDMDMCGIVRCTDLALYKKKMEAPTDTSGSNCDRVVEKCDDKVDHRAREDPKIAFDMNVLHRT